MPIIVDVTVAIGLFFACLSIYFNLAKNNKFFKSLFALGAALSFEVPALVMGSNNIAFNFLFGLWVVVTALNIRLR